jgi:hypothetical protein
LKFTWWAELIPNRDSLNSKYLSHRQFRVQCWRVNVFAKLKTFFTAKSEPEHLRRGKIGERAAKKFLQKSGMKFLTANFRSERGEIDLIFRDSGRKGVGGMFIRNKTDCLNNFPRLATNRL